MPAVGEMTVHFETVEPINSVELVRAGTEKPSFSSGLYAVAGKRVFDIAIVLVLLPILLPVMLVVALVLVAQGHRPFYVQPRVGRGGQTFSIVKFRTMVPNADRILEDYLSRNPEAREEWNRHQKLKNDPRITLAGGLLRRTSMDELPQFLNVLRGDMSIVGPRPMMLGQREMYPGEAYYQLRPGITGPWQVSDRNHCEFRDRAAFDSSYAASISFVGDLSILLKTVSVVLRGTGY